MSGESRIPLPADPTVPWYGTPLDYAINTFAASTMRLDALDPIVTELVRLKCARYHDCRLCQSLRLGAALDAGLDETMADKIDRFELSDLDERIKVALRLTDAMIIAPGSVDTTLAEQVREWFSPQQIMELALDIMKWGQQKAQVSLRIEVPPRGELSLLQFDEAGDAVLGEALANRAG
jgi:hypothetical protein